MKELVSVIVPVYNLEKYLNRCIESLVNQSYPNLEIILVDDGSTDGSGEVCDTWAKQEENIRVIHKENGGLSDARNAGLEIAKGDYIGFVDGDDWIDSEMYQMLYTAIINTKCEIAECGVYLTDGKHHKKYKCLETERIYSRDEAIIEVFLERNLDVSACNKLYKKSIFKNVRYPVGKTNEDAAVILDIFEPITGITHVGKPLYYYFNRVGSISNTYSKKNLRNLYDNSIMLQKKTEQLFPSLNQYAKGYVLSQIITILKSLIYGRKQWESEEIKLYVKALDDYNSRENRQILSLKRKVLLILIEIYVKLLNVG